MTIEDGGAPVEPKPLPQPRPRPPRRSRARPFGIIIVAAVIAVAALAGLSAVADYALRDRTASSPAAPRGTLPASPKAPALADGADGLFLSPCACANSQRKGGNV